MTSFWRVVNEVIRDSDVILEILDARFPEETRNREVEDKIKKINEKGINKKLIYILNKSDLIKEKFSDIKLDFEPYIFVSAKENLGTTKLRTLLKSLVKKDRPLIAGIVGYPNTGKSSLINALKQKRAAGVGSVPGFTRGLQKIRISKNIYLLDTPGVFAYKEKDETKGALTNVRDYRKVKDPEFIALEILRQAYQKDPKIIEDLYKIKPADDPEETLGFIAKKFNWLVKGGKPNIDQTARRIIMDWQRGKLIV